MNPDFAGRVNVPSITTYGTADPTDPPTLTIRAVRCHGDGDAPEHDYICVFCHARGPEPGFVWPEWVRAFVIDQIGDENPVPILNGLYAAQTETP